MAIMLTWPDTNEFLLFWSLQKNKVCEKNPKTINELKYYIHDAFRDIDEDQNLCHNVCQSVWTDVKNVAMLVEDILST